MGSPITFSNFNSIDFNLILTSVMQQESLPLQTLQAKQSALSAEGSSYASLATKVAALETAAAGLSTPDGVKQFAASVSDQAAVGATISTGAIPGRYEVVVNELARAQVTASSTSAPDPDTTVVATGGSITIGTVAVQVTGPLTLAQLAAKINSTGDVPASAAVVQSSPGAFRLVLTGVNTGQANAFTIANGLTGGTGVGFTDSDGNGISGDTGTDNTVQATDASLLINNLAVTSTSNTVTSGIPGVTLTLNQKDSTKAVVVTVAASTTALLDNVNRFVAAYNSLVKFAVDQAVAAKNGSVGTLARDPLLRGLRNTLRSVLSGAHGNGTLRHLAEVGIEFDQAGTLTLKESTLIDASRNDGASLATLFAGAGGSDGAFSALKTSLHEYSQAGGFVAGAQDQLRAEIGRLASRIDDMQARLAVRRAALQKEFIAADQAMSALKAQSGGLASFWASSGSGSGLFTNS